MPFPWHVSLKSAGLLDPFRHRSLARAFSLQDPRKIEPHEVHRGVLSVRSTLEQQVHGAFPGRVTPDVASLSFSSSLARVYEYNAVSME